MVVTTSTERTMNSKTKSAKTAGIADLQARKLKPSQADEVKGGWWMGGFGRAATSASSIEKKDSDTKNAVISKIG
jgi:hypothetical protein